MSLEEINDKINNGEKFTPDGLVALNKFLNDGFHDKLYKWLYKFIINYETVIAWKNLTLSNVFIEEAKDSWYWWRISKYTKLWFWLLC